MLLSETDTNTQYEFYQRVQFNNAEEDVNLVLGNTYIVYKITNLQSASK